MQNIVRNASEPVETCRIVEIPGYRYHAMCAQHRETSFTVRERVDAVTRAQMRYCTQRHITAAYDQ